MKKAPDAFRNIRDFSFSAAVHFSPISTATAARASAIPSVRTLWGRERVRDAFPSARAISEERGRWMNPAGIPRSFVRRRAAYIRELQTYAPAEKEDHRETVPRDTALLRVSRPFPCSYDGILSVREGYDCGTNERNNTDP